MPEVVKNNTINGEETEKVLFNRYKKCPSIANRNYIVKKYMYLAEILSKKFLNRGADYEDVYQVACLALIKAVKRFKPEKGVKFTSFATPTIVGELKRFFRDKGSAIRVPRRIYESYQKINKAREFLTNKHERVPKVNEISAYLNMTEENVLEIMESWNVYSIQSFDRNIYHDDNMEMHEYIGIEDSVYEKIENRDFLEKAIEKLNEDEKKFIKMRYTRSMTQKKIADKLGVSQMYISRLERKLLKRFRSVLNKEQ